MCFNNHCTCSHIGVWDSILVEGGGGVFSSLNPLSGGFFGEVSDMVRLHGIVCSHVWCVWGSGCGFHGKVGVVCWLTGGMFISLALG